MKTRLILLTIILVTALSLFELINDPSYRIFHATEGPYDGSNYTVRYSSRFLSYLYRYDCAVCNKKMTVIPVTIYTLRQNQYQERKGMTNYQYISEKVEKYFAKCDNCGQLYHTEKGINCLNFSAALVLSLVIFFSMMINWGYALRHWND